MRVVIATLLLLAAVSLAYADDSAGYIDIQHDAHRGVTCWILTGTGISCLPDSQLKPSVNVPQDHNKQLPAPASFVAPSQAEGRVQL